MARRAGQRYAGMARRAGQRYAGMVRRAGLCGAKVCRYGEKGCVDAIDAIEDTSTRGLRQMWIKADKAIVSGISSWRQIQSS